MPAPTVEALINAAPLHKNVAVNSFAVVANAVTSVPELATLFAAQSTPTTSGLLAIANNADTIANLHEILLHNSGQLTPEVLTAIADNRASDRRLLQMLVKNYPANDYTDGAIVGNPNVTAPILTKIAKRSRNSAVLQKIITAPRARACTIQAVVKNPAVTAAILQDVVNGTGDETILAAVAEQQHATVQILTTIAEKSANAKLLQQIANDQRADEVCLTAVINNSAANAKTLRLVLQRADPAASNALLQQVLGHAKVTARVLQLLACHPNATEDMYQKILAHPNISLAVLNTLAARYKDPAFLTTVAKAKQAFGKMINQQQKNLAKLNDAITASPELSATVKVGTGSFYLGASFLPAVIVDFKQNEGNQVFNRKNTGGDVFVGYYIMQNAFVELGYQRSVTRGGELWVMRGNPYPGGYIIANMDYSLTTKINQQLPYLAIGVHIPVQQLANTNIFLMSGVAILKFNARYYLVGNNILAQFDQSNIREVKFSKRKTVAMIKLGVKKQFSNNFGLLCSGSWFDTNKVEVTSQEAAAQKLTLGSSYTVGLGAWYLF